MEQEFMDVVIAGAAEKRPGLVVEV